MVAERVEDLDIETYVAHQQQKQLLRFLTCGSVDDGKSTLIGRLLHDSAQIYDDQLATLKQESAKIGNAGEALDLALLVDGLQAEREQGITIDVAYRYFSSQKRKFIIADTPGHEQYTRNMATGASTCDVAVILIDARYGVQTQTKRHAYIASLLGIKHLVIAINKMDLVDYQQSVFDAIRTDFEQFAKQLRAADIRYIPLSALTGDNVVATSKHMPWYTSEPLLTALEDIDIDSEHHEFRFPVQYVQRPDLNFRGFSGTVASGSISVGDEITVLPSDKSSVIASIVTFDGDKSMATKGEAITLVLEDEIDISRGDVIVKSQDISPTSAQQITAELVWMQETPLKLNQLYDVKVAGKLTQVKMTSIEYITDVNTLDKRVESTVSLNTIAKVKMAFTEPMFVETYRDNHTTGAMIIIDRLTNATAAAVMVTEVKSQKKLEQVYSESEIELNAWVRKTYPHWQALDISK
ncbi:sulfate adenylyltransferase subunit CysN [Shewanella sp. 202IG2-18]|uniref:sulfate adenylyltransferase subunit CysN n=1 Tax=Parashewanella hymeniacidonis TaxID=2807618 RepID=UPI00195F3672|nr:sulfate adenylyltransferase subunit CysN [Parashewanella hymeniacidonis]MBM7071320.1 sulfate adenylyltransferase subunit CysN [Parashewanella hymeniacidonis]